MEWENIIQDWFDVNYPHEKFEMHIQPIDGGQYSSIKFNNNSTDVQAVEFGAAINKYDIVNELGEENIRQTVGKEYENWLATTGGCQNDPDTNTYLDTYINYLNSNYQKVDKSTDFLLYDDEEVKAFAKDLKEYNGTTLQYIGIMPKNISLDSYIEQMNSKELNTIITNLKEIKLENFKEGVVTKVIGYIPLFKFDYELDLINDLKELGITDIFDINKSDLSGMIDNTAVIDSVSHKANIEFSNEGIKAAAVTQLGGLGSTSCGFVYDYDVPVETIDLTFDNPYLFLIRDKNSGEIWFTGTVYNPLPTK